MAKNHLSILILKFFSVFDKAFNESKCETADDNENLTKDNLLQKTGTSTNRKEKVNFIL